MQPLHGLNSVKGCLVPCLSSLSNTCVHSVLPIANRGMANRPLQIPLQSTCAMAASMASSLMATPWQPGAFLVGTEVKKSSNCNCPWMMMSAPDRRFRVRLHHCSARHHHYSNQRDWLKRRSPVLYFYFNLHNATTLHFAKGSQPLEASLFPHWKVHKRWKFWLINTLEYSTEPRLGNPGSIMPVTRRAKHQATSLMAATKASAARTGRIKKAKPPLEEPVQAIVHGDSSQSIASEAVNDVVMVRFHSCFVMSHGRQPTPNNNRC